METITIKQFDGETIHPSLDIKNDILIMGFRYREKPDEEKELFLIAKNGNIVHCKDISFFEDEAKKYFLEKGKRKLIRIEERWSIAELNQFLNDHANVRSASFINAQSIFEKTKELFKKYVELETDEDYSILTAWTIGTYFFPIFSAYPFLNIKAPKRSGKSQCLNILNQLCFNSVKARPTLAALGDTVDALRGTYLIDQADSLDRKGGEELLDILTDSYKKSGGKRRVLNFEKKSREILEFETYSPKVFASIRELPEDLCDRCFIVPLMRSQRNFPSPDDESENWKEIRGNLYKLALTHFDLIITFYTVGKIQYKNQSDLVGRELELWLPLEVIFKALGITDKVELIKKRFLSQYGFAEYEPSELEEEVVKAVLSKFQGNLEVILTPREISELLGTELFPPKDLPNQRAAKVGWTIKKFNLSSEKKARTKEGVKYLFEKPKVEAIYKGYFKTAISPTSLTPMQKNTLNPEQISTKQEV